jgi:hypothetical protein
MESALALAQTLEVFNAAVALDNTFFWESGALEVAVDV